MSDAIWIYQRELRRGSQEVREFGEPLRLLHARLFQQMYQAGGVGLAAPQIGVFLQTAVIDWQGNRFTLTNPTVLETGGDFLTDWEGCLSIPGKVNPSGKMSTHIRMKRPSEVKVRFYNDQGEEETQKFEGFLARVVQHEIDHLRGRFFIDHLTPTKREMVVNHYRNFLKRNSKIDLRELHV